MRPAPGRLRGLLVPQSLALVRIAAELMLVAALFGRSAPEPAAESRLRQPAHPRYQYVQPGAFTGLDPATPHLFDTEAGGFTPVPIPEKWKPSQFACSP